MGKVNTDEKLIDTLLSRGIENVYPDKKTVKNKLMSGEQLKLYLGVDPTGPSLHIGHGISIRKLAEFQKLGHEVILLIGDFTAMIGDPSDKAAARTQLSKKQVLQNCKDYKKQVAGLIDFEGKNKAKLEYNSSWLGKLSFEDVLNLASKFTVQQMIERDMFEKRIKDGKPIYVHEFMYPLMQGYDTVAMDVDLEIGGNDQTFNMLAGRTLMKAMKNKEKFVITNRLLVDPTGKKMGKTEGNMIVLTDSANDMFGKVMAWTDPMIISAFEIVTDVPEKDIKQMQKDMDAGANPRDYKLRLAFEVVKIYKDEKQAQQAQDYFINVFSNKKGPEQGDMETVSVSSNNIIEVLVESKLVDSKSEARRVIEQGGLKVDDKKITDIAFTIEKGEHIIQKGKRHFIKVKT